MEEAIVISAPKEYPLYLIEDVINLSNERLKVKRIDTEHGIMNGIEWALPTIVVVYLAKPFFEAFLKEAGKDLFPIRDLQINYINYTFVL